MILHKGLILLVGLALVVGCSSKPKLSQLSGKVTFKGKPVPAGYLTFTPDVSKGNLGQVIGFQIREGEYDSSKDGNQGIPPGTYKVIIAGFDGVRIPMYGQGKQIFNPVEESYTVPDGVSTKDFVIPIRLATT